MIRAESKEKKGQQKKKGGGFGTAGLENPTGKHTARKRFRNTVELMKWERRRETRCHKKKICGRGGKSLRRRRIPRGISAAYTLHYLSRPSRNYKQASTYSEVLIFNPFVKDRRVGGTFGACMYILRQQLCLAAVYTTIS